MKYKRLISVMNTPLHKSMLKKDTIAYVILASFLGFFVILPLTQTAILYVRLSFESRSALNSHNSASVKEHEEKLTRLKQTMQIIGDPIYSIAYNTCYEGHRDGGWMIMSYNYNCQLSYIDFFDVPAIAHSYIDSSVSTSELKDDQYHVQPVVVVDSINDYVDNVGGQRLATAFEKYYVSLLGNSDARVVIIDGRLEYIEPPYKKRTIIKEEGNSKLDSTKRYLVFSDSNTYYHKDVGCSYGKFLFCFSPI